MAGMASFGSTVTISLGRRSALIAGATIPTKIIKADNFWIRNIIQKSYTLDFSLALRSARGRLVEPLKRCPGFNE
jgi:hypothetical protein